MRMTTSDENLACAAALGDRDAFAVLIERRYDDLYRIAFRLTGNRNNAEDLLQDFCTSLPAKLRSFRGDAKFTTWAYRIMVNACHDQRRKQQSHQKTVQSWGDLELLQRAMDAEAKENLGWLMNALTSLPETLRDTVALLLDGEMSHAQAGIVLGVSEGTVSWRFSEAKKKLREIAQREQIT